MKRFRYTLIATILLLGATLPVSATTLGFQEWASTTNTTINNGCLQFSYTTGTTTYTFPIDAEITNPTFSVDVDNSITNKIGGNGEVIDTYTINATFYGADNTIIGSQTFTGADKHATEPRTLIITYTGIVSNIQVSITGIDKGFWAGFYGPIVCNPTIAYEPVAPVPAPEPTPPTVQAPVTDTLQVSENETLAATAPENKLFDTVTAWYGSPTDPNCGADVSATVQNIFAGQATASVQASNNVFGDPCGGVVKILRVSFPTYTDATPAPVPTVEPTSEPTPTSTPAPEIQPSPSPVPSVEPTVEPPAPAPVEPPVVAPPVVEPPVVVPPVTEPPVIVPQPQPQPIPFPVTPPAPEPTSTPTPTPTLEPTPEPTVEPTPAPEPPIAPEPSPEPSPVIEPMPTPEPTIEPESTPAPTPTVIAPVAPEPAPVLAPVVEEPPVLAPVPPVSEAAKILQIPINQINPETLTAEQTIVLFNNAIETFATAIQGSEEYEEALQMLAIVADADDPEIPSELASIPLLGASATAVLEAFNDLGNIGADISPKVRKELKKVVLASIISAQASLGAIATIRR